jgi:hypothetical protein
MLICRRGDEGTVPEGDRWEAVGESEGDIDRPPIAISSGSVASSKSSPPSDDKGLLK